MRPGAQNTLTIFVRAIFKIGVTIFSVLYNFRKGRRKDKDSPTPPTQEEYRQYLEDQCLKERLIDADFYKLVALPHSLDYNEWCATHSKYKQLQKITMADIPRCCVICQIVL